MIKKYPASSPSSSTGRLIKRSNVRSTRKKKDSQEEDQGGEDLEPQQLEQVLDTTGKHVISLEEEQGSNVFCCSALADATHDTLYCLFALN